MVAERRGPPTMPPIMPAAKEREDALSLILQEQQRTNELLVLLIEAMADEGEGEGEPVVVRHLDGTPA